MRYAQIDKCECCNGLGIGVSLFTAGCPYHCAGCQNMSTWATNGGQEYTKETQEKVLDLLKPDWVSRLSILGGEPLLPQNMRQIADLLDAARAAKPDIKIWLWTGTTFEDLQELWLEDSPQDEELDSLGWTSENLDDLYEILGNLDYLVDGRFIKEKRDITLAWRGSSNQRVLDMRASMDAHKPVLAAEQ